VENCCADINQARKDGCTPLFIAAGVKHLDAVRYFKKLGADVDQAKAQEGTAVYFAAQNGHLDMLKCLVNELGANVNKGDKHGCTPLFIAAYIGNKETVVCLVEELGADVNLAVGDGRTPLMAATKSKHAKIVRYLLKNGANAQASAHAFGTAANVSKLYGAPAEQIVYLEARTYCANISCTGAGLKKCASCLEVFFCSKDCQVAAWPEHKVDCKRRVAEKAGKHT
jgi:ankyrin repeat protein